MTERTDKMAETERTVEKQTRRSLKPLRSLSTYLTRYRGLVAGAGVSLVMAAATTLTLPIAVRTRTCLP